MVSLRELKLYTYLAYNERDACYRVRDGGRARRCEREVSSNESFSRVLSQPGQLIENGEGQYVRDLRII